MSNTATARLSLHPAPEGWQPIMMAPARRFFIPFEVVGAGDEAQFLDTLAHGEEERAWLNYLAGMRGRSGDLARALWSILRESCSLVPIPQAGPIPDGGFQFVWDRGEHHLEIDILPDRSFEWFYRNRRTGELAGDDSSAGCLPKAVKDFLARVE